jgi:hypothetical protein
MLVPALKRGVIDNYLGALHRINNPSLQAGERKLLKETRASPPQADAPQAQAQE